ncbi:hypothetical protein BMS3Bbin13_00090 [bacterium BMS3Bbin13]|nr:hypothetical protein BMS3Bbin13_00090 [bacterium BMS3Bbin13]
MPLPPQAPATVLPSPWDPPGPHTIETSSGARVDLFDPDPASLRLDDIAFSLCRISRYTGHTREPYSVGSHSMWVAQLCLRTTEDPRTSLYALLHDAHEAYIGDIPTPVKNLPGMRDVLRPVVKRLQNAIFDTLGLAPPSPEQHAWVAWADALALVEESRFLMPSRGFDWGVPVPKPPVPCPGTPPFPPVLPQTPEYTVEAFLSLYGELRH